MVESRWWTRAGPGFLAVAVLGLLHVGPAGADDRAWSPAECPESTAVRTSPEPAPGDDPPAAPWYRLDTMLDDDLSVRGQRLTVGIAGAPDARALEMDAESFAAGPYGGLILTGSDDGLVSRLRLIDVAAGCALTVATERDVIRRATIDPGGAAVYEFRVDRRTRADLGVWRRPLDGSAAGLVVPALGTDLRFGRTFATELSWSIDGSRLVVQSCAEVACRTRLVDPAGGAATLVDDPDLGEVIGVADDRLVAYVACRGLPCPVVAVDLASRDRTTLADDAGLAVVVTGPTGPQVVHEVGAGRSPVVRAVDLDGRERRRFLPGEDARRLVPGAARARAGLGMTAGWIAFAPNGRELSARDSVVLRRVEDDRTVALEEVAR